MLYSRKKLKQMMEEAKERLRDKQAEGMDVYNWSICYSLADHFPTRKKSFLEKLLGLGEEYMDFSKEHGFYPGEYFRWFIDGSKQRKFLLAKDKDLPEGGHIYVLGNDLALHFILEKEQIYTKKTKAKFFEVSRYCSSDEVVDGLEDVVGEYEVRIHNLNLRYQGFLLLSSVPSAICKEIKKPLTVTSSRLKQKKSKV